MKLIIAENTLLEINGQKVLLSEGSILYEAADKDKIVELYKILAKAKPPTEESRNYIIEFLKKWVWPRLLRSNTDELLLKIAEFIEQKENQYKGGDETKSDAYTALASTLDEYRNAVKKGQESSETKPKRLLAVYGPQGLRVVHADDPKAQSAAFSTIPNVSRGTRWDPYVKEVGGYTVGAAKTYGEGAGGAMPFILVATSDGDLESAVEYYKKAKPDLGHYPFEAHVEAFDEISNMLQPA